MCIDDTNTQAIWMPATQIHQTVMGIQWSAFKVITGANDVFWLIVNFCPGYLAISTHC